MCSDNRLKLWAIIFIAAITLAVVVGMSVLSGVGAVEAGIDIAVVTIGINGIISVIKYVGGTNEKSKKDMTDSSSNNDLTDSAKL